MALHTHTWEQTLLSLAYEARQPAQLHEKPEFEIELLKRAYAYCDSLTALHSRSFHLASGLLPPPKRQAARALYAFCRVSDDIVDRPTIYKGQSLVEWRNRAMSTMPAPTDLVAVAWADARLKYAVPQRYAEQLIEGVARDLHQSRYDTFSDLASYCYGVASTVGLMSMHIIGYRGTEAIPYAIKLGVALQLTNILRDIAEDWLSGRIYLPQQELERFALTERDVAHAVETKQINVQWQEFMRFQIERNRRLYAESLPGIGLLDPDGRFAIGAAAELYRSILVEIEKSDYNVFTRRVYVSKLRKICQLPGIWWRNRVKVAK